MQAHWDEARQSQLPTLELLVNMGYEYISAAEVNAQRGEDTSKFILKDIAFAALKRINQFEYKGEQYDFSDKNVLDAIEELENIPLNGLQDTAKEVYQLIMTTGGKTFPLLIDGAKTSKNFRFIDFENPENNSFHVTAEMPIAGREHNIRPDVVCFVNGIPFVVIENKKSGTDVAESLRQHVRNQQPDRSPKFFVYPQLLIGTNVDQCLYGTTGTPKKFFAAWKEKEKDTAVLEAEVKDLIGQKIDPETYKTMCRDLNGATFNHQQITERIPTTQDKTLYSLLTPQRLLHLTKHFMLFDAGIKKVARYQQYFAINKMLTRVQQQDDNGKRQGGLVWHTQGSGKSLTMVLFVKALIDNPKITNPRVIIVTDRKSLDKQMSDTFRNCNLKKDVIKATSGKKLLEMIKDKDPRVITSLVHKFERSAKSATKFVDEDPNIFVLIDEAHRTQYGIASEEMRRLIPNACFIGFTGTPLLKNDKSHNRFGGFIDKYTIDDALSDGIVLPLVYEGRYTELKQDKEKVDRMAERIMGHLDDQSKKDLQKYISQKVIKNNPNRLTEIAYDIEKHFCQSFQGTGLKAQVVAPSKFSAILMHRVFAETAKIKTAVVMSATQAQDDETDSHKKEVADFLQQISQDYKDLDSYEKAVVKDFKSNDDGIELIIVVSKLLTGFDAPRNTVLYLTKDLKDHNLLQAIARVNRLYDNEKKPKTSGFIIDYSENAQNIQSAMELFGSFDEEDVKGTLIDTGQKVSELEQAYFDLEAQFKTIKNKQDTEEYLHYLGNEQAGEQRRNDFYKNYNSFLRNFDECLSLPDFSQKFAQLDHYKRELKRYGELRKTTRFRFADKQDLSEYKHQIKHILDKYITAEEVQLLTEPIDIHNPDELDKALAGLHTPKSKAEAIAAQMERTIREKRETDPEFYDRISKKVRDILDKMHEKKLADAEALKLLTDENFNMAGKVDDTLPDVLKRTKGADIFYRNIHTEFEKRGLNTEQQCKVILDIFSILKSHTTVDWHRQPDTQRQIKNKLDDYLYDEVKLSMDLDLSHEELALMLDNILNLAVANYELF